MQREGEGMGDNVYPLGRGGKEKGGGGGNVWEREREREEGKKKTQ